MFHAVYGKVQKSTLFEKLLLVVGISIGIVGFWLINTTLNHQPGVSWEFLIAVFLWFLLIFVVILTDSNESIKEELGLLIKEQIVETKLLKAEFQLFNSAFKKKK